MPDWGITLAPTSVHVSFVVAPVPILLHSLQLVTDAQILNGMSRWLSDLHQSLTPQEREDLDVATWFLSDRHAFDSQNQSFPQFLNQLEHTDVKQLRDEATLWMTKRHHFTSTKAVLDDYATYETFMRTVYAEKGEKLWEYDEKHHRRVWEYLNNPAEAKSLMVSFLSMAWEKYLKAEWKRVEPMLRECAEAFEQVDFSNMPTEAIVEAVTARDLKGRDFFEKEMTEARHIQFVPSPHIGPYVTWLNDEKNGDDMVFFGARMPQNSPRRSDELSRSELLTRLNALADETRLRMLEMLTREEEICAQDFITALDLSQSSASRHLRQLTASGYLTERRRDVAKCYSLNKDRINDTIKALSQFVEK
jgi:DNA-binding transcriptional ArsR family regulator